MWSLKIHWLWEFFFQGHPLIKVFPGESPGTPQLKGIKCPFPHLPQHKSTFPSNLLLPSTSLFFSTLELLEGEIL